MSGKMVHEDSGDKRRLLTAHPAAGFTQAITPIRRLLLTVALAIVAGSLLWCWGRFCAPTPVAAGGSVHWPPVSSTKLVDGLSSPVHVTHADDGSGRLFVVEQVGRIRIVKDGSLLSTPFLSITSRVRFGGEQGLLSMAFPPDYASKGYFYVNYTDVSSRTVVARYHVTANPEVADPDSEQILLTVDQPYANHNGGQLAFGPDGYLYIGMGDGGSGGDPQNYAQNPASLLGKMLRIDVEAAGDPTTYTIPAGNPYTQTSGYRGEIWALGLRNPWRFSFDRQTGDLYIGDVGQNTYEEVDYQPASSPGGENYGWKIMEGFHCYGAGSCDTTGLTLPVKEYNHTEGCSITGGMVYRGPAPSSHGIYFYADYCNGRVWGLQYDGAAWQSALLHDAPFNITGFGDDEAGRLYTTDYFGGAIYELAPLERIFLPLMLRDA